MKFHPKLNGVEWLLVLAIILAGVAIVVIDRQSPKLPELSNER